MSFHFLSIHGCIINENEINATAVARWINTFNKQNTSILILNLYQENGAKLIEIEGNEN